MSSKTNAPQVTQKETKERLLSAALVLFSQNSFDSVSTRQLTEFANVNLAAIPYYFGSKKELYLALAQSIVDWMLVTSKPAISLDKISTLSSKEAQDTLNKFLRKIMMALFQDEMSYYRASFIVREQHKESEAFELIYEGFMGKTHQMIHRLVAKTLSISADSIEAKIRAHGLMGQILFFIMGKPLFLRKTGWDSYSTEQVDRLATVIQQQALYGLQRINRDLKGD